MKHTLDLWGTEFPSDYRWDKDQNAKLLNIVFQAGTFGNFLKFFLDKFSNHSPDMPGDPFTKTGTSHEIPRKVYSGLIQRYHASFINDNEGNSDLPICLILPSSKKHFLYLKKAQWYRSNDSGLSPDDLWQKTIREIKAGGIDKQVLYESFLNIKKLYGIKDMDSDRVPKFIVRDWYKLEFLQEVHETYNYQLFDLLKKHTFFDCQKIFHLDLETFFNWETFIKNIKKIDRVFGLELNFNRVVEMQEIFQKGIELDTIRQECNMIEKVLTLKTTDPLRNLDVASEGFIYAELERRFTDIQMPLTNKFFDDYKEIEQFLQNFPNWYLRSNPNIG
jgi:hypothetical protein